MSSGVPVADDCKVKYDEIKKDKKYRYVIYVLTGEKKIEVEKVGERNATYDDFLEALGVTGPNSGLDCRYGLFDFEYSHQCQGTTEATMKQKLFLMSWCPDTAKVRQKMIYTSSFDQLKKAHVGVHKFLQATSSDECTYDFVEGKLRETDRN